MTRLFLCAACVLVLSGAVALAEAPPDFASFQAAEGSETTLATQPNNT